MKLSGKILNNLNRYSKDMEVTHRMARRIPEEIKKWTKALYNNNLIFIGADKQFSYEDFSKIDFNGPELKHQEWQNQINRFFWLKFALIEYEKNGSMHMAKIVKDSIQAWMDFWENYGDRTDIFPFGKHKFWYPMINTPIRLGHADYCGWWGCAPHFFKSGLFSETFIEKMVESTLWQIKPMLYNNIHRSGEHNWRVNELESLLFLSCVVPGAEVYQEYAVENLNDAFIAQFEDDGSHVEHTDDYHNWMCKVFAGLSMLAMNRPSLGLDISPERVLKTLDYGILAKAPDGRSFGFHDSECWHINNKDYIPSYISLRDKIAKKAGLPLFKQRIQQEGLLNVYFKNAQQFFFRTDHYKENTDAKMFFFDASRWGQSHTHMSNNSVNFFYGNKMLLCDPGSLDYNWENPFRAYGKSTPSHNTITINGLSQLTSNPEIEIYDATEDYALIVSNYSGGYKTYRSNKDSLLGGHERLFLWIKEKFALVFDYAYTYGKNSDIKYASHWQLPVNDIYHNSNSQNAHTTFDDYNVALYKIYSNIETKSKLYYGNKDPLLGWLPKDGGKLSSGKPAPMFSIEATTNNNFFKLAQLILPFTGEKLPQVSFETIETRYAKMFVINYKKPGLKKEKWYIASSYFQWNENKYNSMIRTVGNIKSNARLAIACSNDNGQTISYKKLHKGNTLKLKN